MSRDPIFIAIEQHRLADAAYDDAIERGVDGSLQNAREGQRVALIDLL